MKFHLMALRIAAFLQSAPRSIKTIEAIPDDLFPGGASQKQAFIEEIQSVHDQFANDCEAIDMDEAA